MMHIFSDIAPFETVVLYPEKYPNWFKIFSEHSRLFINISKEEYELQMTANPILEEFAKMNAGREPEPLKYHFDSINAEFETILTTPRAVYFLNIDKEEAKKIQSDFGIIVQSTDSIDDNLLRYTFYRNLPVNTTCSLNGKNGWNQLLDIQKPPSNSLVISDNFLFVNEDGIRGVKNIVQLIEALLPDDLKTDFNILVIAQEHKDKDRAWCNKLTGDIKTALNNLNKPYNIIFEIVFAETIHKRIAISNYFTITPDKGFAVFKSVDLTTIHEDTEIQVDHVFHRINENEGDTEFLNAEYSLKGISRICKTVAQYISNRPNDKNYRIMGDCHPDKSLKNRLINDV
jgi:hypothetical protein